MEITRQTIIGEVLGEHPECISVFEAHGMDCRVCMGAASDTIEEGCLMHSVDLDRLLEELQECCRSV